MNAVLAPRPEFRDLVAADLDAVVAIERVAYAYPWTPGNFRDCLESGYLCRGLWVEGDLVGYGILMTVLDEAHILNCCIAPAWQGRGLGHQLALHLIDATPADIACVFLEVRPSNHVALALYERLGFETVGLRRHYYPAAQGREDALLMRRCA